MEKSKLLKTLFPIITAGRVVATVTLSESSRPETMIRGEEELVESDTEYNNFIHQRKVLSIKMGY